MTAQTLTLLDLLVKGTAILLLGFACITFLRRHSAAQRSLAWLAVFAVMLVLPLAVFVRPVWTMPVLLVRAPMKLAAPVHEIENRAAAPRAETSASSEPPAEPWSIWQWMAMVYAAGVACVLAFRLIGSWQLRRLKGGATGPVALIQSLVSEMNPPRRVGLLCSARITVPMTWGTYKPVLMLPMSCVEWSDADLRAALEHELAHIRHGDAARRWLGTLVSALWWPHPLVWIASKAWRLEQERACDDAVVRSGSDAARYATQLIDAARNVRLGGFQSAAALVMAMPSGLETRLRAVVRDGVNRSPASRAALVISTAMSVMLVTLCAVCQAQTVVAPTADGRMVYITSKFVEADPAEIAITHPALKAAMEGSPVSLTDAEMQELIRQLSQKKGVDMMSPPSVTTRSGQRGRIEVVREFVYPTAFEKEGDDLKPTKFELMPIGVAVDVGPSFDADGAIRLRPITATVNEFLGFITGGRENLSPKGERGSSLAASDFTQRSEILMKKDRVKKGEVSQPVFSTKKWSSDVTLKQGEWKLSCLKQEGTPRQGAEKQIWFFVSAKEVKAEEAKAAPAPVKVVPNKLLGKARTIIIPKIEFKGATLPEAVAFLRAKSRDLDPEKQGINIIVKDNEAPVNAQITLDLRDVPLWEAVRYVAELSGMEPNYEAFSVVMRPVAATVGDALYSRVYHVPARLLGGERRAKKWLSDNGIAFQEGAGATFDEAASNLVVKNTTQELSKIEMILDRLSAQTKSPAPGPKPIIKRADQLIIPKVEFKEASLAEAVDFLRAKSKQIDLQKQGVNIILNPEAKLSDAKLTLELKDIPLTEALRYVTELAGMKLVAGENAFEIVPLNAEAAEPKK